MIGGFSRSIGARQLDGPRNHKDPPSLQLQWNRINIRRQSRCSVPAGKEVLLHVTIALASPSREREYPLMAITTAHMGFIHTRCRSASHICLNTQERSSSTAQSWTRKICGILMQVQTSTERRTCSNRGLSRTHTVPWLMDVSIAPLLRRVTIQLKVSATLHLKLTTDIFPSHSITSGEAISWMLEPFHNLRTRASINLQLSKSMMRTRSRYERQAILDVFDEPSEALVNNILAARRRE